MASHRSDWPGLKTAALLALGLVVAGWQGPAQAAQLDCEAMAMSLNPGDNYQFKLEIQSKMIRLEKGEDFCTESAKDWFKRQLILPPPARESIPVPTPQAKPGTPVPQVSRDDTPLPGQPMRQAPLPDLGLSTDNGAAPLPIQREFVKPKKEEEATGEALGEIPVEGQLPGQQVVPEGRAKEHVSSDPDTEVQPGQAGESEEDKLYGVVAPPPPKRDDSLIKRCDRDLVSFWSPGEHEIEGQKFWLSGVFTIDLDSDGRVDDVGFKIKAEGKIGNILNYFPTTEGRLAGKTVDSLKLDDDRDIHRLCPGNITFERPGVAPGSKKKRKASQVSVLGGEKTKEGAEEEISEEEPQELEPPKKDINPVVLIVGGIAMLLMLAGGIGLALGIRNMTSRKDDEYEDDEYEYEDDDYEEEDD